MKKPFKSNRIACHLYFAAGIALVLSLCGCKSTPPPPQARTIPITDEIIAEVGGIGETPRFLYFISKTITLRLVAGGQAISEINEEGQLIRSSHTVRDTVEILATTSGLVRNYQPRSNESLGNALNVAFENYQGNPVVLFGKATTSTTGRYNILYTDASNYTINYGGSNYTVSYEGDEAPYLLIRIQESSTESESYRRASGLELGQ
ncbi:MAG: hypothetical protein LBQ94_10150 [Treponema sp.]|jgi:hypothetical protein|nr:hypothetical protein [Treponema sp.]